MKTKEKVSGLEKRSASRRMKGRYSARLSNRKSGGRHASFRGVPEYYRLVIESLSEYALITMDKDLNISSWSAPTAKMFGYAESEIIGKNVGILFTPEDLALGINVTEFRKALENGRENDNRWHVCKDGRRLWCYGLSFPLKDEKGTVRGFVKLIRDDTARKRQDDLLRENEERLSLAAESTALGTWDYDIAKNSVTMSKRAADLFNQGDDPEHVTFERFLEAIDPQDRPRIAEKFARYLGPDPKWGENMEFRIPMNDGGFRWVLIKARAFIEGPAKPNDKPDRLIGTVVDITEQRHRQLEAKELKRELEQKVKTLIESEKRYEMALESAQMGAWDLDIVTGVTERTLRHDQIFGYSSKQAHWGVKEFLLQVAPEDRETARKKMEEAPLSGILRLECAILWPDQSRHFVSIHGQAAQDASGKPTHLMGVILDITDRQRRQLAAEEFNRQLETKVKERTASLSALNKELEAFAYSASHDLRAPLRKIAAFAHAISKSAEGKLSADEKVYLDSIRTASERMKKMIDDQLNLAQASRKPLSIVDCDLSEIARSAAEELRQAEPARRVEFVIADGIRVKADRDMMSMALRSLFANAWKFTSKHPTARVEFGMKEVEGRSAYFVRDDGAGFDMRFAKNLFREFHRLHSDEEFPGTGVGLGLVERIIRRHRGQLWAEAAVEKGAAFFFTLDTEAA